MKVVHMDATRQRYKIMGTFGINKQGCSNIIQPHRAHQKKDLPKSNALSPPLPWDWRTEVRGEVITSEEHTRAVATTSSENVKRQAWYKSFPTDHINGGHRGVAHRQALPAGVGAQIMEGKEVTITGYPKQKAHSHEANGR